MVEKTNGPRLKFGPYGACVRQTEPGVMVSVLPPSAPYWPSAAVFTRLDSRPVYATLRFLLAPPIGVNSNESQHL